MKIVIDSSVWISLLIRGNLSDFVNKIKKTGIEICISTEQINELTDVLIRDKFRKHISDADITEFLHILFKICVIVEIKERIIACRDPKDDFILDIALNAKAGTIVTLDKDLLSLSPFNDIEIINHISFMDKYFS